MKTASQALLGQQYEMRLSAIPIVCLFCGNGDEQRYMCSACRTKSLGQLIWIDGVHALLRHYVTSGKQEAGN